MVKLRLILAPLISAGAAAAINNGHTLHEKRDTHASHEWVKRDSAPRGIRLPIRVGMAQSNLELGAQLLYDISNPDSAKYGQHLSAEEVHDLFAPSTSSVDGIMSWLSTNLVDRKITQSVNKQWIQLEATTEELEALLKTSYHTWEHLPSGRTTIACDEYSVPYHLVEHVDYITPGVKLHMPTDTSALANDYFVRDLEAEESSAVEARAEAYKPKPQPFHGYQYCAHEMTPQCIQKLYNVTGNFDAVEGNDLGVYAPSYDRCSTKSLENFFSELYPQIPLSTVPKALFVDSTHYATSYTDGELCLDLMMAYPLAHPQNLSVWYVDDKYYESLPTPVNKTTHNYNPSGQWNTWLDAIDGSYCNYSAFGITGDTPGIDSSYPDKHSGGWDHPLQCGVYKPTKVMSISYYQAESWLPMRYLQRQCNEYMKLGLQGSSIFFCTGDSGAGGGSGSPRPESSNHCLGSAHPPDILTPNYPASCPFVTGVGATKLPVNSSISNYPEVVSTQSSGGFSNIWTAPDYQKAALSTYFSKHHPAYKSYSTKDGKNIGANGGVFNRIGRGYPDVSAVGEFVVIGSASGLSWSGGTSASTPIWAGLLTRINAARLKAGRKTVGFINPVLYKHPEAFHDVTQGHNIGCQPSKNGYNATPGWDPTTGLGTPNFGKLMDIFMALP